jgi:hypothetical protein
MRTLASLEGDLTLVTAQAISRRAGQSDQADEVHDKFTDGLFDRMPPAALAVFASEQPLVWPGQLRPQAITYDDGATTPERRAAPPEDPKARVLEIIDLCTVAKLPHMARDLIASGQTIAAIRRQLTNARVKDDGAEIDTAIAPDGGTALSFDAIARQRYGDVTADTTIRR